MLPKGQISDAISSNYFLLEVVTPNCSANTQNFSESPCPAKAIPL
jgi:hypothetical protein